MYYVFLIDAPDVAVKVQNTTTAASSSDVRCEASGVPNTYRFITWEHRWLGQQTVLRSFPGSRNLHLENLTYEYSGFYTCRVENGANYSRNPHAGVGSAYLQVHGTNILKAICFTSSRVLYKKEIGERYLKC